MKTYRVEANPNGGTCYQYVKAESRSAAVQSAIGKPNNWQTAEPKDIGEWDFRVTE